MSVQHNMTTMGKEASLEGLEFDGDTVLCRVCGDKASGFHYGVHACEGCKGFFRRSIQQKIQYRPCLKNQQCNIMRVNRNRCQYCRLKKCIAVGMSKDAVRFGRVPKKEKARIIEQMHKSSIQSQTNQMMTMIQNTQDLIQAIVAAHQQTSLMSLDSVRLMKEEALRKQDFIDCPAHMACPLNSHMASKDEDGHGWMDMSELITPAIKSVVNFARLIPGFSHLSQDDQVTLLKAATFEVLLVRFACLFDPETNTMMFADGKLFKRHPSQASTNAGFLLDSMFDFAERFNALNLSENEIALFSAVVLLSPDRPGLRNTEHLESFQMKLTECLQTVIAANHKEDSTLFAKLLMKTTDLRTLNMLHSEKSIGSSEKGGAQDVGDHQDGQFDSAVSEGSTSSDVSSRCSLAATGYDSGIHEGNGSSVSSHRHSSDSNLHQQVILKTPYGTFCREDASGFYGMVPDTPIRRCHTLERDILSRPRLHTIEEKRRYTLEKDYVDKHMQKMFDKHLYRGSSMPSSLANSRAGSAASSPIPPEFLSYQSRASHEFTPISIAEALSVSARGSPMQNQDSHLTLPSASSKPGSPNPRSRSGSMGANDLEQLRPRCYSFHMNSEGRASRYPMQKDQSHSLSENMYMSPDMRRGSVGASYGLYHRKKSLLVDRHPRYLSRLSDGMKRVDKPKPSEASSSMGPGDHLSSFCIQVPSISKPIWNPDSRESANMEHSIKFGELESKVDASEMGLGTMDSINESDRSSDKTSDSSEPVNLEMGIFHKKFDKVRKHARSTEDEALGKNNNESHSSVTSPGDDSDDTMNVDDVPNYGLAKLNIHDEITMDVNDKPKKKTAVESHPQLLAQLNTPSKNPVQSGFLKLPLKMPPSPTNSTPQSSQVMLNVPKYSSRSSSVAKEMPTLASHLNSAPLAPVFPRASGPHNNIVGDSLENDQVKNSTLLGLKDRISQKNDIVESREVTDNHESQRAALSEMFHQSMMGNQAGTLPGYMNTDGGQKMIPPTMFHQSFPMHPAFLGGQSYQPMFMTPGYNQHLAGMQQLAQIYAKNNEEHMKRSEKMNLMRPASGPKSEDMEMMVDQKIKYEESI